MRIFETERLLFRRLEKTDFDALFAIYCDSEVRRYFPDPVLSAEETHGEIDWFLNGHPEYPHLGLWATIHKPSSTFIGRCGLLPWHLENGLEVETAYLLARPYWRRGLGAEALLGLVRHGFGALGLEHLAAFIHPENDASKRTALKAGFAFERPGEFDDMRCDIYGIRRP